MKYIAKPYLLKNTGMKEFDDIKEAVLYLEKYTGYKMDFVKDRKTKEKTYDWELVGSSSVLKRNPIARDLRTAKYRARVVRSKKAYKRKGRVAQLDRASDF